MQWISAQTSGVNSNSIRENQERALQAVSIPSFKGVPNLKDRIRVKTDVPPYVDLAEHFRSLLYQIVDRIVTTAEQKPRGKITGKHGEGK